MKSLEIYNNIKNGSSTEAYVFLKNRCLKLIQVKFTSHYCEAEAEDRFAFSFTKLYETIKTKELNNTSNMIGYFLTICRNNFLIEVQRNKVFVTEHLPEVQLNTLQDELVLNEMKYLSQELIDTLPKKLRIISYKIYVEGKNHKEIAEELGMDYQNVRKYQYKAIQLLKNNTPFHYKGFIGVAA